MKVPFSWLKDYVDITITPEELSEKLFSCGFEVEEIVYLGEKVTGVVVGQIESIIPHPDSDHMSICSVNVGEQNGGVLQIVTGATNIFEGMKTPCALDGSTVVESDERALEKNPSGIKKIKKGKLRGVESFGMLCSGEELGINDDYYDGAEVYGLLMLADDVPVGEDIRKVVGLDDYIFDISITANRPDCQSVLGIAREVAAVLKQPLKMPATDSIQKTTDAAPITVEVKDSELCPRYMGTYVQNVKPSVRTPDWMRRRLAVCGIRSISPIVDITNFVLLEIGQPMHAFDADKLAGRKIIVRRATAGEKIKTLDEKEFTLTTDNLVICDAEKPVALAGVMGGADSGISVDTKNVYFESAKFARDSVRKTSRALGQISDSSLRFEKGVDAYSNALGLARALHLIEELGVGDVTCVSADECAVSLENRVMQADLDKINGLLGITVPDEVVLDILERLCFKPTLDGKTLTVEVPAYRDDIDGYPDLAEEIIRMYGYEHITPTFLERASVTGGGLNDMQKKEMQLKETLVTQGYYEACNYSFYSPKDFDLMKLSEDATERNAVKILNPISEELSVLRTFLSPSMLSNAVRNIRRGNDEGREFEVANIYIPNGEEQPIEKKRLVLGVWGAKCDFFDMKGAFEKIAEVFHVDFQYERAEKSFLHPGVSAQVLMDKQVVGYFGELDPAIASSLGLDKKVYLGEMDVEAILAVGNGEFVYKNLPKFADAQRDLALLVDEKYTCAEVEEVLNHSCKYVTKVKMFDLYRGKNLPEGKKSMAFTLTFAVPETAEKPFSADDLDGFVKKILNNLKFKLGVELR